MNYDSTRLLDLLDKQTIQAIMNIYNLKLKHIAARLGGCTKQNVKYHIDNASFKDWQKKKILDLFQDHGLEAAELVIIHTMVSKRRDLS